MTTLTCLHFTDLHRSLDWRYDCLFPNAVDALTQDLRELYCKTGPWDLVLFTGDLVYSGGKAGPEFDLLRDTLGELWKEMEALGPTPQLLAIPGNHDLTWPDPTRPVVKQLRRWRQDKEMREEFWTKPESEYRKVVAEAFENYQQWWQGWQKAHPASNLSVTPGLLPGDFAATYEKEGWKIGVVGLNSTFLQLSRGAYERKLAVGLRQLAEVCGKDKYPSWFKERRLCLLMTHHPPDWLDKEARQELEGEIAPPGRFQAHLCGHLHVAWSESVTRGGAKRPLVLRGGALFGLEHFGGQEQRLHGYSVLKFDLGEEGVRHRRWPRVGVGPDGGWRLDKNIHAERRWADDEGTPWETLDDRALSPVRETPVRPNSARSAGRKRGAQSARGKGTPVQPKGAAAAGAGPVLSVTPGEATAAESTALQAAFTSTMQAARALTSRLWDRLRPRVVFEGQKTELRISGGGDTSVRGVYSVSSSTAVPFVPYTIAADEASPPMAYLRDLDFRVRALGKDAGEVLYLQTENLARTKRCVILFLPEVTRQNPRRLEVAYSWPGLFAKLVNEGRDELFFEWRRPVEKGEVRLTFSRELGRIRCTLLSGRQKGASLRSRGLADGSLIWRFYCRKAPPGEYLLLLEMEKRQASKRRRRRGG